jgi:hypothetical protein
MVHHPQGLHALSWDLGRQACHLDLWGIKNAVQDHAA